jgi:hypothetical protein
MFINKVQVFQADTASRNPCIVMHLAKPDAQSEGQQIAKNQARAITKVHVEEHVLRAKL